MRLAGVTLLRSDLAVPHQQVHRRHRRCLREPGQMRRAAAIRASEAWQRDHRAWQADYGAGDFMLALRTAATSRGFQSRMPAQIVDMPMRARGAV